jgi:uncharacterized protein (DUF362 family)
MSNKVAIVKCFKEELDSCMDKAISLIGDFDLKEGSKIVIKPNLCCLKSPEDGATTDVKVVEAVVIYIKKHFKDADITIVESTNGGKSGEERATATEAFQLLGYNELSKKYNLHLCDLNKELTVKKQFPKAKKLKVVDVPKILLSMDYFISIAKMKRHGLERYTGIWKNQYGLIPNRKLRISLHPFLSEALFDLNCVFRPNLGIIDGITALEGPNGGDLLGMEGRPLKMNTVVCSKNSLSADIVTAKIMGEIPERIPHIKYALNHGFKDAKNIEIVGNKEILSNKIKFKFRDETDYKNVRWFLYKQKWKQRLGLPFDF